MSENTSVPPGGYIQPTPGAPPVYVGPAATGPGYAPGYAPGYTPGALAPPAPPAPNEQRKTLGVVALVLAVVATIGASILSATTGAIAAFEAARRAFETSPLGLEEFSTDQLLAFLSPVRELVLWAEIGFWAGTILGIWALVQGIIAIVTRRGRGLGIAAVVIAALGPLLFASVVSTAVLGAIGAAAG